MVGEWAPVADDGADRAPPTPPFDNPERQEGACAPSLVGSEKPFMVMVSSTIPDLHLVGAGAGTQCFPFYVYDEDGTNRRENITDWALKQFQEKYQDLASRSRERPESGAAGADAERPQKFTEEEKERLFRDGKEHLQVIADYEAGKIKAIPLEPATKSRSRKTPVADATGSPGSGAAAKAPASRAITKWDIFHYVYGLLHHPGYRTKYSDNLKRELPRI